MTLFYAAPFFQEHLTGEHPERPERLVAVTKHLQFTGVDALCRRPAWEPASEETLALVHPRDYIQSIRQFAAGGGGWIESDTFVSPKSFEVARLATGAVCDAVRRVSAGEDRHAFCLLRPPGHHALAAEPMGFCLFNHVAVGARLAVSQLALSRVLVVDFDVHHGNGTQAIFWEDGQIGFFSIHRFPFYPGTGAADETGAGPGLGATKNVPVEFGTSRDEYLRLFRENLEAFAERMRPELVLVSAGFDAHRCDPIGSLQLETVDFATLTEEVLRVANQYAGGRVVSVLEGGYNPEALSDSVEMHLETLLRSS